MAKPQKTDCSLSEEEKNRVAHLIAEHFLQENFRIVSEGDYRRKLGNIAQMFPEGTLTEEQLHQFLLYKLSKLVGGMFGWTKCDIIGTSD